MNKLNVVERKIWIDFHSFAYNDDFVLARNLIESNPRWSIIAGYYAMHDITKLYLGKVHNIKISGLNVHKQTIEALKFVLKDNMKISEIIGLIVSAEEKLKDLTPDDIPYLLKSGKSERGKVQYYSKYVFSNNQEYVKKAREFYEEIVNVYIKILEEILKS